MSKPTDQGNLTKEEASTLQKLANKAMSWFNGKTKNLDVNLDSGKVLVIAASGENGKVVVGDPATIDGAAAADGTYVASETKVEYTVLAGAISAIKDPTTDQNQQQQQDQGQQQQQQQQQQEQSATVAQLQKDLTAMTAERDGLKNQLKEKTLELEQGKILVKQLSNSLENKVSKDIQLNADNDQKLDTDKGSKDEGGNTGALARKQARKEAQQAAS